ESSPINYATLDRRENRFLLINGTHDDIVDPALSQQFWQALNQAGIYSRRMVLQGAGHFFASDPLDEPGSLSGMTAPRVLRFLQDELKKKERGPRGPASLTSRGENDARGLWKACSGAQRGVTPCTLAACVPPPRRARNKEGTSAALSPSRSGPLWVSRERACRRTTPV